MADWFLGRRVGSLDSLGSFFSAGSSLVLWPWNIHNGWLLQLGWCMHISKVSKKRYLRSGGFSGACLCPTRQGGGSGRDPVGESGRTTGWTGWLGSPPPQGGGGPRGHFGSDRLLEIFFVTPIFGGKYLLTPIF